ncbi:MAG: hypothetical protein JXQ69_00760 [Paludibacteraceae bacterium]|nr:hypothetical protein [Paludibacteraceae bacterium]MBN2786828.1 hypothetical protein [Paludibacteraceae bacterium]
MTQQQPSAQAWSNAPAQASTAYTKQWTAYCNPAIISTVDTYKIAANYVNRFQLKKLSTTSISSSIPTKIATIGLALSHFGYSQYNEIQGGVAVARNFTDRFHVGMQFNYYAVLLSPTEGYKNTVIAQIGIISKISDAFFIGFHTYNPAQTNIELNLTEKRIPSIFSLGTSYHFSDKLLWLGQLDKEIDFPLQWRTGFEYLMVKEFSLKIGGYGNPFVPNLGVSVFIKQLQIDLNFERNPTLGINSICGLSYTFR